MLDPQCSIRSTIEDRPELKPPRAPLSSLRRPGHHLYEQVNNQGPCLPIPPLQIPKAHSTQEPTHHVIESIDKVMVALSGLRAHLLQPTARNLIYSFPEPCIDPSILLVNAKEKTG